MNVECLVLGLYETNCYIVSVEKQSHDVLIIDTGLDVSALTDYLKINNLKPVSVILTHGHVDHIVGAASIRDTWKDIKLCIHSQDAKMLSNPDANLSLMNGSEFTLEEADVVLKDGYVINQAGLKLSVIHTPGHTPGCICLHSIEDQVLFSGDTLFAGGIGRTDFPGGSTEQLITSIKEKLLTLPPETVVYPGHGPRTTIGREIRYNSFLG